MLEQDIRDLIDLKCESANLDYKAGFPWTKDNRDKKFELIRDLLGMANTRDGGRIIFGITDGGYDFTGVSNDVFESIDPNNVVQMLHDHGDPKAICQITKIVIDGKKVVAFDIQEFEDTPIICISSIRSSDQSRLILREGAVYIQKRLLLPTK